MTLNLDTIFDRNKISELLVRLENEHTSANTSQVIQELKGYMDKQLNFFDDLKYAINLSTTITMTDRDGRITYVDQRFCNLTGFSREELLNRNHRLLNSNFHDKAFFQGLWETILGGNVWTGEIKNRKKDGTIFWVETTIVPLPNCYIAFRTDITKRKQLEAELVETLENDYTKIFNSLVNLVFRIEKDRKSDTYIYTMVKGKLANKLGINYDFVSHKSGSNLPNLEASLIKEKFDEAYQGKELAFKHKFKDLFLYTMLSPIIEDGEVVEVIGSSVDITSLEQAEQQVRYLAYYDPLTDLPNRSKLREDLEKKVDTADKDHPFAVLYCDLDRLKYINDVLGQFAGDQVLLTIAERIKVDIGSKGQLYRFGGDEFIVIIENYSSLDELEFICNNIVKSIKQPITLVGKEFFITASVGISEYYKSGITMEELINHAGIAMHYCKVNGRNNMLFYSPSMNQTYNELLLLEGEVRRALNENKFMVYFQPKVDVIHGNLMGMEALLRWNHPEKGFIPPNKFIPIAEETGLIIQLGEWVIREVCIQHKKWTDDGYEPFRVAVNVSAIELQRSDFADKVKNIIQETGMSPEYLELEITENSVMENTEECIQTMNELREIGISFSIDDFGTGYSSFGYLRKFPINHLKIDQSFVKEILNDSSSAEIVKAMIQLAHTFGLKVIAEGVEDEEILDFLKQHDCDFYQGYYFSRPVDVENAQRILPKLQV